MSIDDQRNLYERLDRAVGTITPRPAPVDGAMRRGRALRLRRRTAVAAGLAAVAAAAAIAVPSLRQATSEHLPAAARHTATVQAPGPDAPAGLIASGTVHGKRWQVVADEPGTAGARPGFQRVSASGPAFGARQVSEYVPSLFVHATDPVTFQGLLGGGTQCQFGAVRADVRYVTVRLADGTVLTLHPVTVHGIRAVAFAVPAGAKIVRTTAYSRSGEIAATTPYGEPDGMASFGLWLRPGESANYRVSGRIGSGTLDGHAWYAAGTVTASQTCLSVNGTNGDCIGEVPVPGTSLQFYTAGNPVVACGVAAASVVRIVVTQPDGTTIGVRPVTVARQGFFAFAMSKGKKPWRWTAYDRSGGVVASSAVTPYP